MNHRIIFILVPLFVQVLCHCKSRRAHFKFDRQARVMGGVAVRTTDFPYVAQIITEGKHLCGGAIIHELFILTAAHCTAKFVGITRVLSYKLKVMLGNERSMRGGVQHAVEKVIPRKNNLLSTTHYDISLIQLQREIEFTENILPVRLAWMRAADGDMGWVLGFGKTSKLSGRSERLMGVEVPVWNHMKCKNVVKFIDDDDMCAGFDYSPNGACEGDSGGPYVIRGELVGIVAAGKGCGTMGNPVIYTDVAFHKRWIEETIRDIKGRKKSRSATEWIKWNIYKRKFHRDMPWYKKWIHKILN